MKRIRYQNDVLDTEDYGSGEVTKARVEYQNKRGNLREDRNGNLITSRLPNGKHLPIIDLDLDHFYIPSRTYGHAHLYLNVEVEHDAYVNLMQALAECKVVGEGNLNQLLVAGHSSARLPMDFNKYRALYENGI